uniref:Uncharacterized protein n=1 Tax=Anguilla anguilla TaxID=7936 RepID=A0A0E9SR98_ANGAN
MTTAGKRMFRMLDFVLVYLLMLHTHVNNGLNCEAVLLLTT